MFIKVFRPSIACEIITIGSGTIYPNKVEKYTKGLTQLFKSTAKIRQFCEVAKFIFHHIEKKKTAAGVSCGGCGISICNGYMSASRIISSAM